MEETKFIQDALIFLIAAVIVVPILRQIRLSPVFGYLVAGILIGPSVLNLMKDPNSTHTLAELGVVFLLFTIGLELSLERLWVMRRYILGLGSLQMIITTSLIFIIAIFAFDFENDSALVIGWSLALSSTAFVLRLLVDNHEQTTRFGRLSISILLLQDLAVIPLLVVMPLLADAQGSILKDLGFASLKAALAISVVLLVGRFAFRPLFKVIAGAKSTELFAAMTLLIVLGMGWITSQADLSMALGAFLAGLLLAESEYRHQVEADIKPFRGFLLGLFFMSIGMLLNLELLVKNLELILLLSLGIILLKTAVIFILCLFFKLPSSISLRSGLVLSQGGEFAFIIFSNALVIGFLNNFEGQILLATVITTMAITPFLSFLGRAISQKIEKKSQDTHYKILDETEDLNNHIVIAGFGRVGQTIAKILSENDIPYVALDNDAKIVASCRAKGNPVFYGNATHRDILNALAIERSKAIVITVNKRYASQYILTEMRKAYPNEPIIVRAKDRMHKQILIEAGATAVSLETAETSLQLGHILLSTLGTHEDKIKHILDDLRQNDYEKMNDIIGQIKE